MNPIVKKIQRDTIMDAIYVKEKGTPRETQGKRSIDNQPNVSESIVCMRACVVLYFLFIAVNSIALYKPLDLQTVAVRQRMNFDLAKFRSRQEKLTTTGKKCSSKQKRKRNETLILICLAI